MKDQMASSMTPPTDIEFKFLSSFPYQTSKNEDKNMHFMGLSVICEGNLAKIGKLKFMFFQNAIRKHWRFGNICFFDDF